MKNYLHLPLLSLLVGFLSLAISNSVQAQCKSFTKKQCLSELEDYTGNGQYNGAVMFEGEEAELTQTFYSGKSYRVFICAHSAIADSVYFNVTDYRNNPIYSTKGKDSNVFDFEVESTQQLDIRVIVPEMGTTNELKKNGCVSILVGFKSN